MHPAPAHNHRFRPLSNREQLTQLMGKETMLTRETLITAWLGVLGMERFRDLFSASVCILRPLGRPIQWDIPFNLKANSPTVRIHCVIR